MRRRLPQFEFIEKIREDIKNDLPSPLPCPFCGNPYIDLEGMKSVSVVCHRCQAEGPSICGEPYEAIRAAINAWNLRVPQ